MVTLMVILCANFAQSNLNVSTSFYTHCASIERYIYILYIYIIYICMDCVFKTLFVLHALVSSLLVARGSGSQVNRDQKTCVCLVDWLGQASRIINNNLLCFSEMPLP